jgi:LacI family transcriptional regulator
MPTLHDVAKEAGVSITTVSRVINGTYVDKVSDKTRKRVLQIAREMNYQPNIAARALRNKSTFQIGLVVSNIDLSFTASIVEGVQEIAMASNYSCLLYITRGHLELERNSFRALARKKVDGIIWVPDQHQSIDPTRYVYDIPMVQLLTKRVDGISSVLVDQEKGANMATKHLLSLGHTSILHLRSDGVHGLQRCQGYLQAMSEAHVDTPMVVPYEGGFDGSFVAVKELLESGAQPTAIMAATDMAAWGAIKAANEMMLRVPEDISISGYDDIVVARYISPPLTTIAQPKRLLGRVAMQQLMHCIERGDESTKDTIIEPELVERASTASVTRSVR